MNFLFESIKAAAFLILNLDSELTGIVFLSLQISIISCIIASIVGIPLAFLISMNNFKLKRLFITILNSLLALPTVVIGLFVYAFLNRRGILGSLDLLYTWTAVVIGQTILIIPLITSYTISVISRLDVRYKRTAMTLGANRLQTSQVILREAKFGIMSVIAAAFGRVVSEIGISMMLGGNIKMFTRTMTTAMALEYDKGEFVLAVALGLILMTISLLVNFAINWFQGKSPE
ncbi:MAG: ABC transporter permease [Candidatus Riflebacteria bacterium]|nr:ABC transporter permease [Candidatus Riflebacteria bacterium]